MCASLAVLLAAQPASAKWLRAHSSHFVIYSQGDERALRMFAEHLEQLDTALRIMTRTPERDGITANPVTVYMMRDMQAVQALYSNSPSNVGGFYVPRVSGSVAFTPIRTDDRTQVRLETETFTPNIVFFHEYGHHFMLGNFAAAYPAWFSEGFAEVVSTATFDQNKVIIGNAANHRGISLLNGVPPTSEQLFTLGRGRITGEQVDNIYAYGWLLTHFLIFNNENLPKFSVYLKLLNTGTPSVEAARTAFGNLAALDRNLRRYLGSRLPAKVITLTDAQQPKISIQPVTEGVEAMMSLRMRSERGVDAAQAGRVFAQGKEVAARYPIDPVVQGWLAEMAYDAEDDAAAEAAADRALSVDARSVQALLCKARVGLRRAKTAKADDKVWSAARSLIVKANRADPDSAAALALYYSSFTDQGIAPPKSAVQGLLKAFELVPQDDDLRFMMARQNLLDGNIALASSTIAPIAFSPHAAKDNPAAKLLADLKGGKSAAEAVIALDAALEKAAAEAKAKVTKD